jgi:hypothetical protein
LLIASAQRLQYNVIIYPNVKDDMAHWTRRSFIECSAAAFAAACAKPVLAAAAKPSVALTHDSLQIRASRYSFSWSWTTDAFTVDDASGKRIAWGPLQPAVLTASAEDPAKQRCSPGQAGVPTIHQNRIEITYSGVNEGARLTLVLRFDDSGFWMEPVLYESPAADDIVSLHYFCKPEAQLLLPALRASHITAPGIAENAAVSPIEQAAIRLEQTVSLGHSGFYVAPFTHQQWGLPVHYLCAMSVHPAKGGFHENFATGRSETMVCGLADMPNGDLLLSLHGGASSLWIDYRSDLWHHLRTPGRLTLGATLAFSFGDGQYDGIAAYYMQLVNAGLIRRKQNSAAKNAVVCAPQFCTWGAQVEYGQAKDHLTGQFLEDLYFQMKSSGMKAGIFSIDDKWEGRYGNLEHSRERLPHFVEFLDRIRAEGHHVGLWAAFMRCENPADLGLTIEHMLLRPDGTPYKAGGGTYYILDFTHPEVEKVLTERASAFMRRYKPALVKFDFGYELPLVREAAPFDKRYAGELILKRGLDIVVSALRRENPDVVVMYYQLSPLFVDYFDLHSTDDLYCAAGDYDWEANRRIYFASVLTQLGVPIYGSSGYDWSSSPAIWFDSVASGTIGSLNTFDKDEFGESSTPEWIALYNGLLQTVRSGNLFTVIPFPAARPEAATRGAHTRSWARLEDGKVTLIAQRPPSFDDGDMLDRRPVDPRIDGLITTTAPVVVASKTAETISISNHLAVVGCTEGIVSIKRVGGRSATVTTHCFGGKAFRSSKRVEHGMLTLDLHRKDAAGRPVEWSEVVFS